MRRYPWVLAPVPWSQWQEFTRGRVDGLPLLSWNIAPRDKLATRRQLRGLGLRPGGCDPVAVLYFRCRRAGCMVFASLYLIERARPVRPMTPARWEALDKALAARRTCRRCAEDAGYELPRGGGAVRRLCSGCESELGMLAPTDYRHDYLVGEPTIPAAEHYRATGVLTATPRRVRRPAAPLTCCGPTRRAAVAA